MATSLGLYGSIPLVLNILLCDTVCMKLVHPLYMLLHEFQDKAPVLHGENHLMALLHFNKLSSRPKRSIVPHWKESVFVPLLEAVSDLSK